MKTTVEIPDSLFQEAKAYADSKGIPFRQIVEDGLRAVIQEKRHRQKRFRLRDGSYGGQGLRDDLSWPEIRTLIYQGRGE